MIDKIIIKNIYNVFNSNGFRVENALLLVLHPQKGSEKIYVSHYPISPLSISFVDSEELEKKIAEPTLLRDSIFFPGISEYMRKQFSEIRISKPVDYLDSKFDWNDFIISRGNSIPLIALPPNCRKFFLTPIVLLNTPIAWIIHEKKFKSDPKMNNLLVHPIQFEFFNKLLTCFEKDSLIEIRDEKTFVEWYIYRLAKLLLPSQIMMEGSKWRQFNKTFPERDYILSLRLNETYSFSFGFPQIFFSSDDFVTTPYHLTDDFGIIERQIKSIIKAHFRSNLELWHLTQSQKSKAIISQITGLLGDLKPFQEKIDLLQVIQSDLIIELENTLKNRSYSNFEFFKVTTYWHIRWNGKIVKAEGRNDKGLGYIHRLLRSPDQIIDVFEMEGVYQERGKNYNELHIKENFSARVPIIVPESEKELNEAINRLKRDFPREKDFESKSKYLEAVAYQLAEMYNINHSLISVAPKAKYIEESKAIKRELDEIILDLEQLEDGLNILHKNVLTQAKKISLPIDYDVQKRRARQRVTKNIKNAIKSLKSDSLSEYFLRVLDIKTKLRYKKTHVNDSTNWVLFSDD